MKRLPAPLYKVESLKENNRRYYTENVKMTPYLLELKEPIIEDSSSTVWSPQLGEKDIIKEDIHVLDAAKIELPIKHVIIRQYTHPRNKWIERISNKIQTAEEERKEQPPYGS